MHEYFLYFNSWAQGYDGSKAAYINRDTICFRCGNNIKFVKEDGQPQIFPSGGEGLGPIAMHNVNKVFAVAELGIDPKVNIFQYPTFKHVRELTGNFGMVICMLIKSYRLLKKL